jgi:hypothetical protein
VPLAYLVLAPVVLVTAVALLGLSVNAAAGRPGAEYLHISRTTGSLYLGFVAMAQWLYHTLAHSLFVCLWLSI